MSGGVCRGGGCLPEGLSASEVSGQGGVVVYPGCLAREGVWPRGWGGCLPGWCLAMGSSGGVWPGGVSAQVGCLRW